MQQHNIINQILNSKVTHSNVEYLHTKTIDSYFQHDQGKIRKTTDENTKTSTFLIKKKIADLEIYSPNDPLDLRISINLESTYSLLTLDVSYFN